MVSALPNTWWILMCVHAMLFHSCTTLCDPMECSPQGFFVHGILLAGVLEWVAMPFSRGTSQPRDWTQVSCIAGRFFTIWATREAPITYICQQILFSTLKIYIKYAYFSIFSTLRSNPGHHLFHLEYCNWPLIWFLCFNISQIISHHWSKLFSGFPFTQS